MKIITLWNIKGGVGKTSLSLLTGKHLSTTKKVLFIDLDSQKSLSNNLLENKPEKDIYDFLMSPIKIQDCIYKLSDSIDLLPSNINLQKLNGMTTNKLQKSIRQLDYDFIIVDCPPYQNGIVSNSILTSDLVLIPSCLSLFDLESLNYTITESKELNEKTEIKVILNKVGLRESKEEKEYISMIESKVEKLRFPTNNSLRKVLDRNESLDLKKHIKLKQSITGLVKDILK